MPKCYAVCSEEEGALKKQFTLTRATARAATTATVCAASAAASATVMLPRSA